MKSHTIKFIALLILATIIGYYSRAQPVFLNEPPVTVNGRRLASAWSGGLNCPQFSTIDLNQDPKPDLFIFDKQDNAVLTFLNQGADNWAFAPKYALKFPTLQDWALLRDYDGDGDDDIFSGQNSNILVHKNLYKETGKLTFTFVKKLYSDYYSFLTQLYSSSTDVPGIIDIDSDGDLDFLVNTVTDNGVEYHRNFCIEKNLSPDSLDFKLFSACWGHFREYYITETGAYDVELGLPACSFDGKTSHFGGCLLPMQLNGDTLIDLIISDYGTKPVIAMYNGGVRQKAKLIDKNLSFPTPVAPARLSFMPGGYYLPIENGTLIFSPNMPDVSEDRNGVLLYANDSTFYAPSFRLKSSGFLQNEMLDFGTGAYPCLADFRRTGEKDLIVGIESAFSRKGAALAYLRAENGGFTLITDSLPILPGVLRRLVPAAGDLNADGLPDLVVGEENGTLLYYENSPNGFVLKNDSLLGANIVRGAAPFLYDMDADFDLDLIVGDSRGFLTLFENIGDVERPLFQKFAERWGGVAVTDSLNNFFGYATPSVFDLNDDGVNELIVGSASGFLHIYDEICKEKDRTFRYRGKIFDYDFGVKVAPLAFRADEKTKIMVGVKRGGLLLFNYDFPLASEPSAACNAPIPVKNFSAFPNPATVDKIKFRLPANGGDFSVYDLTGKKIFYVERLDKETPYLLYDARELSAGLYIARYFINEKYYTLKFVITP